MFKILCYIEKKINHFESKKYISSFISKIIYYIACKHIKKIDKVCEGNKKC